MKKGYWEHQLREALLKTYEDEEPHARTEKDALRKHMVEAGRKGGLKPKGNGPIFLAVSIYMWRNKKSSGLTNETIARNFCKKHNEDHALIVPHKGNEYEVFCTGDHIFARVCSKHAKKAIIHEKSITYTTLRNSYIPQVKIFVQGIYYE